MADSNEDEPLYVCVVCGHEDDPDRFGQYCPVCGTDLDELEAEQRKSRGLEFHRGVLFALSRLDPHSTEYLDIVNQAGGFEVLEAVAEPYDQEHLNAARESDEH